MLTGMRQDFSWRHSAEEYLRLYRQTLRIKHGS
jgi:glycogen synthase